MRQYIVRRLLQVIPTILMITLVMFAMMQAIPGDPIVALLGDAYDAENAARLRAEYGLNQPIIVQYAIWLGKLVQGVWGESYLTSRSVLQEVLLRLPITIELIVLAMGVALLIVMPAGIIAALRQNTWVDYTAMTSALVGISIPDFFGTIKVVSAIAIVRIPIFARLVRGSVLSVKEKEYIEACRAVGQNDDKVLFWHILPNCMTPIIVTATLAIATAIMGRETRGSGSTGIPRSPLTRRNGR